MPFPIFTYEKKQISEYTGLNFLEIDNLAYWQYRLYRRDGWIAKQMESEQGREFLKDLKRLQQTNADEEIHRVSVKS
ncbi:MAG: hypothetical protein ACRCX8_19555 [Sarcina sp.]